MIHRDTVISIISAVRAWQQTAEVQRSVYRRSYAGAQAPLAASAAPVQRVMVGDVAQNVYPMDGELGDTIATPLHTNSLYEFVDSMVANVCPAVAPQVTVNSRTKAGMPKARFRQALVNDVFKAVKLNLTLWELAARTAILSEAFLKVRWNAPARRPMFQVLDPVFVSWDKSAPTFTEARWVVETTIITLEEYDRRREQEIYKDAPKKSGTAYPDMYTQMAMSGSYDQKMVFDTERWVVVHEFYDLTPGTPGRCYHVLEDMRTILLEDNLPYRFVRNPYFRLAFNISVYQHGMMADAGLIQPLISVLDDLDNVELCHAQAQVPREIVNSGAFDNLDAFLSSYRTSNKPGDVIVAPLRQGFSLRDAVAPTATPTLKAEFYRVQNNIQEKIRRTVGLPAYERGAVEQGVAATAYGLADSALRTRNGRRTSLLNVAVEWAAETTTGLFSEYLPQDEAYYARLGITKPIEITREAAGFPEVGDDGSLKDPQYYFDFEVVAGGGVENNRAARLQAVTTFAPLLTTGIQAGVYDKDTFFEQLAIDLGLSNILADPENAFSKEKSAAYEASLLEKSRAAALGGAGGEARAAGAPQGPPVPGEPMTQRGAIAQGIAEGDPVGGAVKSAKMLPGVQKGGG